MAGHTLPAIPIGWARQPRSTRATHTDPSLQLNDPAQISGVPLKMRCKARRTDARARACRPLGHRETVRPMRLYQITGQQRSIVRAGRRGDRACFGRHSCGAISSRRVIDIPGGTFFQSEEPVQLSINKSSTSHIFLQVQAPIVPPRIARRHTARPLMVEPTPESGRRLPCAPSE